MLREIVTNNFDFFLGFLVYKYRICNSWYAFIHFYNFTVIDVLVHYLSAFEIMFLDVLQYYSTLYRITIVCFRQWCFKIRFMEDSLSIIIIGPIASSIRPGKWLRGLNCASKNKLLKNQILNVTVNLQPVVL